MMRPPALVLLMWACAWAPGAAAQDCYAVDAAASAVTFRVMQAGNPFSGGFRRFGGELCYAQGRVARIDVWLDPSSVATGLPELDAALKGKDFFSVADFPRVTFVSAAVRPKGDMYTASGKLEIKGTRRDVEIEFRSRQAGGKVIASGEFTLDRLGFGIGTGDWANTEWLGADVKVDFKATLERRK